MKRKSLEIDALLKAPSSSSLAAELIQWANETRSRIVRGDMMIGILTFDEVAKIPVAYRTAAQYGDPSAWVTLAWWHAYPEFGESDLQSAENALQNAIDADVNNARIELVKFRWYCQRETATESEQQQAYQWVAATVASEPKNSEALYFLALLTTHGFGVAASPDQGFELQQQSADLGNADAMFELYVHYAIGLGVPADDQAAFQACQRAADAGHSRAMYNLGAFNASGRGIPKSIPDAIHWYHRAADAGNPSAMAGLAAIYASGDGVEMDREYAEQLLDQADYCGLDVSDLRIRLGLIN